jgi:hypothetical protein
MDVTIWEQRAKPGSFGRKLLTIDENVIANKQRISMELEGMANACSTNVMMNRKVTAVTANETMNSNGVSLR